MSRPFAVIGITVFAVLMILGSASEPVVLAAFAVFTAALLLSVLIKSIRRQSVFPVAFAGAAVACLLLICVNEFYYYPTLKLAGSSHSAKILITDEIEAKYGNYYAQGTASEIDGERAKVKLRLVFSFSPEISPYDTIEGDFAFYQLGETSEDLLVSYKSQDRFVGAYPESGEFENAGRSGFHPGMYVISVRNAVKKVIMKLLPNDYGALCIALMTGERTLLSGEAYDSLRDCSITHIICVSGLHISIWCAAILWILRKMHLGKKLSCMLTIPALLALIVLTGMTYSVLRAGIMMLIFLVSEIISQRRDSLNSLGAALIIISVLNPYSPQSLSLKLSALSTLGIILCSIYVMPKVTEFYSNRKSLKITEKPVKLLIITAAAAGITLPVTVTAFGGYSFAVFPANLIIVPVAEVCMICSAFGTAIGLISLHIPNLFAFVSGLCAKFILKIAQILSSLKILRLSVGYTDACLIFAGIFIFLALAAFLTYTGRKVFPLAGYLAAFIFVMSSVFFAFSDSLDTTLTVFDTGNGSAAYFRSGDDCILLGCGGDAYDGSYRIKKMLRDFSDETDAVILPEDTADYNSYLRDVSELVQGSIIYCPDPGYALKLAFPADKIVSVPDNFQIGLIKATLYKDGAGNSAYMFESKDMNLLYICEPGIDFASLPGAAKDCDVMLCRAGYPDDIAFNGLKLAVIQAEESRGYAAQEELTDKGLNAAATAGCGDMVITADDHNIKAVRR